MDSSGPPRTPPVASPLSIPRDKGIYAGAVRQQYRHNLLPLSNPGLCILDQRGELLKPNFGEEHGHLLARESNISRRTAESITPRRPQYIARPIYRDALHKIPRWDDRREVGSGFCGGGLRCVWGLRLQEVSVTGCQRRGFGAWGIKLPGRCWWRFWAGVAVAKWTVTLGISLQFIDSPLWRGEVEDLLSTSRLAGLRAQLPGSQTPCFIGRCLYFFYVISSYYAVCIICKLRMVVYLCRTSNAPNANPCPP